MRQLLAVSELARKETIIGAERVKKRETTSENEGVRWVKSTITIERVPEMEKLIPTSTESGLRQKIRIHERSG